ncbi:uncharacterized protein TRIADDRAFT_58963 [Trichoplax adhaerens]|uniref:Major facilitator superfamily (MFS) profile domain-containing protein n=1 Tax=Trichoplax adhaerens TaxID=10228 RepID=B3S459_TRIAD|nr:hypothetical protein TRIADDRAFT_58963 [Trichoplax adhaerens]EDV22587.1 hypothetical protein TRIADDRAFT_58963 [Trichoplax adhaerens]|eukprot:XP_002115131.1 hypothetical protein TRIADDRAFT_58963 [Trichoplax adhaerens]
MADNVQTEGVNLTLRSRRTILIVLSSIYFGTSAAYSLLSPFFPEVAHQRGVGTVYIGLIFAIYPLAKGLTSLVIGVILPYVSIVYLLWAGLFLEACGTMIFGFLPHILDTTTFIVFCFVTRWIQGMGAASYQTSAYACVASVFSDSLATTIGILETFTSLGFVAGPPIGGLLYKAGGYELPFVVIAIFLLIASCVIAFTMPRMKCFGVALFIASSGFIFPLLSLHIKPLRLTIPQIGLVFLILPGAFGLFSFVAGIIADKIVSHSLLPLLYSLQTQALMLAIGLQFLGPATYLPIRLSVTQTILANVGLGIGLAIAFVPSYTDVLKSARERFGQHYDEFVINSITSGLFSASLAVGQIIGPAVAAAVPNVDVGFDWATAIFGFALFGQAILVIILTVVENTFMHQAAGQASHAKENVNNKSIDSNVDNEESKPLLT